jgi:hypothetical protein
MAQNSFFASLGVVLLGLGAIAHTNDAPPHAWGLSFCIGFSLIVIAAKRRWTK